MSTSQPGSIYQRSLYYNKLLSLLFMFLFFMGYWLYAWQLERIDYTAAPPNWWTAFIGRYPLFGLTAPFVLVLVELFSPRVLRHLVPLIVGGWLARIAIHHFLKSFFDLPDQAAAKLLLDRLLARGVPSQSLGSINHQNFDESIQKYPQLRVGGPGYFYVEPGSAVLMERNGRFSRVLGPDNHALDRFERPAAALDIRPQERATQNVKMVTSDGIDLMVEVSVTFQIDRAGQRPTRKQPFPFDPLAARKAGYAETILEDGQVLKWDKLTLFVTANELRKLVADSRLDELIRLEPGGIHPHPRLKREMEQRARKVMRELGVQVNETYLGRFELPDPVVEQNIKYWQAQWERQRIAQTPAQAEVENVEMVTSAHMIRTVIGESGFSLPYLPPARDKSLIAIRFVEAMETLVRQSNNTPETGRQLTFLAALKQQIQDGNGDHG